jgi:hypothetical protein
MPDPQQFELTLTAEADVIRGCCGGSHEVGECPQDQASEEK